MTEKTKRILGLDVGDKRIGVAVSDAFGWTAQAVKVINRDSFEKDVAELQKIIETYAVEEIVVGLPKNMDGSVGERAIRTTLYSEQLNEALQLPVVLWDERLSTVAATRTLLEADLSRRKRKQVIDKLAAVIILQGYLDLKR